MKRFYEVCATFLVALFAVGCQGSSPPAKARRIPVLPPSARPTNTAGLSSGQINQAARLWVGKCARCHPLYDPGAYRDEEWGHWMLKMSQKAHLKPDQDELLSRYLGGFRAP